eukprot:m.100832 g.100832  ORF g.100832 m.100832 type:complete len:353 (+) comp10363_c1_seq1:62-1120(+)
MASPSPMTSPIAPSPYLKTEGGITMDLIVTAQDRAKYHNTFTKLDRGTGLISLKIVKALWKKTPLADPVLAHIWKLSDMDRDKHLNEEEFAVGMKLVTLCVTGHLPETDLPDKVVVRADMSGMSPLPPPPFSPPQTPASDTGEHPSPAGPSTSADQSPTTTTTTRTHTARGQAHGSSVSTRTQDTGTHTDSNNNNDDDDDDKDGRDADMSSSREGHGGRPQFAGQVSETNMNAGDLLIVFNFGDGQECDASLAMALTRVLGAPRTYLVRHYDNVPDPSLGRRAYNYNAMDMAMPTAGVEEKLPSVAARRPYQPVIVCLAMYCRKHFDYGAMSALASCRNNVDLVGDGSDTRQ